MGGGATKQAKEPAQDVGDDEVFSPIVPEEKREEEGKGAGMSNVQSVRVQIWDRVARGPPDPSAPPGPPGTRRTTVARLRRKSSSGRACK